jgi:hypothetical protein
MTQKRDAEARKLLAERGFAEDARSPSVDQADGWRRSLFFREGHPPVALMERKGKTPQLLWYHPGGEHRPIKKRADLPAKPKKGRR